jgi:hypothetical protein
MMGSTERRRKLGWMAGAGVVCLGAGSIFSSGCSTTTVSSVDSPAKANQQVAGSKKPAAGKRSATQVASKDAPGKVRISDLDDESRVQMAATIARQKTAGGASPTVAAASRPRTPLADPSGAPTISPAAAESQQPAGANAGPVVAAHQRRATPAAAPKSRAANTIASNARTSAGNIRQTAGDSQSAPAIAKRPNITAPPSRPVITPRKTEWQPENGGEVASSNHERRRADHLMERAYTMYDNGFREEALRLASVAAELENSQQAVYKPGEERPSDFIAALVTTSPGGGTPQSVLAQRKTAAQKAADAAVARRTNANARKRSAESKGAAETKLADATVQSQAALDTEASAPNAPQFSDGNETRVAAANLGKTDVPLPPSPRNADVAVITAEGNRSTLDVASTSGDTRGVVTADRVEEDRATGTSSKSLASKPSTVPFAQAADDSDLEPLSETDAPTAAPAPTSQLTIASLVGLLTGIAGMLGLGWWRRQERQHYSAAPKETGLRIRASEEPRPATRRAA